MASSSLTAGQESKHEEVGPDSNDDCDTDAKETTSSSSENQESDLSLPVAVMMVMNYVGAGYLLLPYGFSQAGPMLGTLTLALVCVQAFLTAFFVLRACQRVTWIAKILKRMSREESWMELNDNHDLTSKLELSFLTRYFLGKKACLFFTITTCLDLYAISWTNASVFAQALADQWPIDRNTSFISDYQVYGLLFMMIAIPLSCSYLLDQLYFQLAFFCARIIMVIMMIITLTMAFSHPEQTFFDDQPGGVTEDPPTLFQWSGFLTMVTLGVFSTAFQFSVPFISSSTELGKRGCSKRPSGIFFYAVLLIFGTNVTLSLLISLYFGDNTEASSNLNWNSYKHGDRFVGKFVVLFAALDGLAVYPLLSLSLGDILMHAFHSDCSEEEVQEMEKDWRKRLPFCLVASIPQAVASLFVSDLPTLAALGVIFTLLSYTACPSLLYLASGARVRGVLRMSKEYGIGKELRNTAWYRKRSRQYKLKDSALSDAQQIEHLHPRRELTALVEDNENSDIHDDRDGQLEKENAQTDSSRDRCSFSKRADACGALVDLDNSRTSREISLCLSMAVSRLEGNKINRASIRNLLILDELDLDSKEDDETGWDDETNHIEKEVSSLSNLDWAASVLLLITGILIVSIVTMFSMGNLS